MKAYIIVGYCGHHLDREISNIAVFLDKEKAEKKLKELENNSNPYPSLNDWSYDLEEMQVSE